ncbi:NAD-dependent epimerase/dehydratase family protein [Metabacillus sp. GX 13764]|uniref:NAD-dependent epimerase/dehydratase family protein n=1 Tax=Metabacillus kandeliae TaxID=2900151 RepID=UPI001E4377F9|nr:NAD-dependent epimerase/dehydratase family protein [Metabacillus kandeliae]MCD7034588.1 NAD-dependent epimerase/dehydratase family protein [Metabacillus kandeliae]
MKKVLITGVNSFVGKNVKEWLNKDPNRYKVDSISLRNDQWKEKDFSNYDVILHVAGIAHVSSDPSMKETYYKVNRDLTVETAKKAKKDGVKQFIFLSSIIVYGDSSNKQRIIDRNTIPSPSNFYGDSKLQAEEGLNIIASDEFKVVIIRPPMIYGKESKGNYPKLAKAARKLPVFPKINNQRSMLHIDNLCEFIRLLIENEDAGLFFPQNSEYVNTSDMVRIIASFHGKKILLTRVFNPVLKLLGAKINLINKVFGNLVYEKQLSSYKSNYQIRNFKESIQMTEGRY